MKKTLFVMVAAMAIAFASELNGASPRKAAKADQAGTTEKPDTATAKTKASKYEKLFMKPRNVVTVSCDGGFMTIHKSKGKLYFEMPIETFGKEMLIASTISGTSAADLASIGYKPEAPMHVRYALRDSTVYLTEVNVLPEHDPGDKGISTAMASNGIDPIIDSYKITCWNNDSSAVVFDVTSMFTGNNERLAAVKSGSSGGINMTANFNSAGSYLGESKAFEDNVTVKSTLSYKVSANFMGLILLKKNQPMTVNVTRTILLLPEKKMRPRAADTRVGIFLTSKSEVTDEVDRIRRYSVINRWDVQPSDSAAWEAGQLVEPVKPIVFYIDEAFPDLWKEPVRKGVLRWNKAFEAIGLKNVMQVRDFPKDDPEFDPDNLKYSCIRYIPSMVANAMGPSWTDPTTGEIINASVIVYNDVVSLINNWRFTQTAQVDERVRAMKMPDDVLAESIEYVIAHEVGHCLGFMHNMAASAAYPVEDLRNPEFTAKNGTTASIMDYARFNYIAQPEDKNVSLTPPYLGPYDYYIVEYAYKPVLQAASFKEEAKILEKFVDAHAGNPLYRYGRQQVISRYDPSALEEDLGNDPILAGEYGEANIKYILSHFNEWMDDASDIDGTMRAERFEALAKQYNRYLKNVLMNVGGIYLTDVKSGTAGEIAVAVPRDVQRASLKWVIDKIKNVDWFSDRSITDKFPMMVDLTPIFQYYTALEVFETYGNVLLSSHIAGSPDEAYTISDWADDIYDEIFEAAPRKLSLCDRTLQKLYVTTLTGAITKKSTLVKVKSLNSAAPSLEQIFSYGLYDNMPLLIENAELLREYEETNGKGSVAKMVGLDSFGKPGYNWQPRVNVRTIDESKAIFTAQAERVKKFAAKKMKTASAPEDKAHYMSLYTQLESAMNQ